MDNGGFHKGKDLIVPENIILPIQPPYCQATFWGGIESNELFIRKMPWEDSPPSLAPELNPIERLWEYLKADLKWAAFKTLEQLQIEVVQLLALVNTVTDCFHHRLFLHSRSLICPTSYLNWYYLHIVPK